MLSPTYYPRRAFALALSVLLSARSLVIAARSQKRPLRTSSSATTSSSSSLFSVAIASVEGVREGSVKKKAAS